MHQTHQPVQDAQREPGDAVLESCECKHFSPQSSIGRGLQNRIRALQVFLEAHHNIPVTGDSPRVVCSAHGSLGLDGLRAGEIEFGIDD